MARAKQLGLEVAARQIARAGEAKARAAAVKDAMARPRPASGRGGWRKGAGRKPAGAQAGQPHGVRPFLDPRYPVHVTLRLTAAVGRLRRRSAYQAFRRALLTTLARGDFRVVHISIQAHHVHLLCEADDRLALARGVRGLSISAARRLNVAIGEDRRTRARRGRVFTDRYHARFITSAKQCRSELAYVLNNWRRHREDVAGAAQRRARIDPYSSAIGFSGWAGRDGVPFAWPREYEPLPVGYAGTWLLRAGWRRWGEIEERMRPGPREEAAGGERRSPTRAGA